MRNYRPNGMVSKKYLSCTEKYPRSRKSLPHSPRNTVQNFSDEEDGLVVGKEVDEDEADGGDERSEHGSTVSVSL